MIILSHFNLAFNYINFWKFQLTFAHVHFIEETLVLSTKL